MMDKGKRQRSGFASAGTDLRLLTAVEFGQGCGPLMTSGAVVRLGRTVQSIWPSPPPLHRWSDGASVVVLAPVPVVSVAPAS